MPSCVAALLVVLALVLPAGPVAAQGFRDSWFGPSGPNYAHGRFPPSSGVSVYERASRYDGFFSPFSFDAQSQADRTAYRTLCVRMCDGYYFPISYATDSGGLAHDAQACAAACGSEARLFYHPNPGGTVDKMIDLTGRTYASYPVAFRYRKKLVDGCHCRPQPWAPSELARHRSYTAGQTAHLDNQPSPAAGAEPWTFSDPDDTATPSPAAPAYAPWPYHVVPRSAQDWELLSVIGASPPPWARHSPSAER